MHLSCAYKSPGLLPINLIWRNPTDCRADYTNWMSESPAWEHFEHGADIGVRGYGHSLTEAFCQTALALIGVITEPASVEPTESVQIECEAPDNELLLVDWLNAIIYEMAVRKMLFSRFDVTIEDHRLRATIWGEAVNLNKHHPVVEVKGATYTTLQVMQDERGMWTAQCVVDV